MRTYLPVECNFAMRKMGKDTEIVKSVICAYASKIIIKYMKFSNSIDSSYIGDYICNTTVNPIYLQLRIFIANIHSEKLNIMAIAQSVNANRYLQ